MQVFACLLQDPSSATLRGSQPSLELRRFDRGGLRSELDVLGCFMVVGVQEAGGRGGAHDARLILQELVDRYPQSEEAGKAKQKLKTLGS